MTDSDGAMFEQLRPRLKAISARIVGSEAEAEDVVQDCFLKWHGAQQGAVVTPAAWLTTVVQHQSIDRLRKRLRDAMAAHTALELTPETLPASPEDALLRRAELGEALARLLSRLSPQERLSLVLHEVFECEHVDIASALGTKAVNTRQYLARARKRLRAESDEPPPEEKLSKELVRRFQIAINGMDAPLVVTLLTDLQPEARRLGACANDACYSLALAD
jgi:RNA polymerase sigma-70 factor (ECF subfamily)